MPDNIEPIPTDRALVPWRPRQSAAELIMFDPGGPSPAVIAFLMAIQRDIVTALGLPLEEVESEIAGGVTPA